MNINLEQYVRTIPLHEENAISGKELRNLWGLKNDRDVRSLIQKIREEGYWVCSGNDGYFIATEPSEMEHFVRRIFSHSIQQLKAIKHMRKALKESGVTIC